MSLFDRIIGNHDIAVDLGTATTRVLAESGGTVFESPSLFNGRSAMRGGVVRDPAAAAEVVRPLLERLRRSRWDKPRVLACAPSDVSTIERQALIDAIRDAGAARVAVVPEPMAAAVGGGIDVGSSAARMLVDIGDGVTDCAVIRNGQVVRSSAVRIACSDMHAAVVDMAARHYGLSLSIMEADRLTRRVGVEGTGEAQMLCFKARPDAREACVSAEDVAAALQSVSERILQTAVDLLRALSPAVGAEVIENGVQLSGGGALLPGMASALEQRTGLPVFIAADPLNAVILGARSMLPTIGAVGLWK